MNQLRSAIPQCGPLGTRGHLVIGELGIEMTNRILEDLAWIDGQEIIIQVVSEDQRAENRSRVWRYKAGELDLNGQGNMRRGGGSRCAGNEWG